MNAADKINKLKRQVNTESLGPVGVISNRAISATGTSVASMATWLRQYAFDRPFVTLLLAFQAGYLIARLGRRHAHR